jgi:hypothetical protein
MSKRKPGEKEKKGKTKEAILKYILNHPQGIEEDKLRSYLKENFNISDKRGIKGHLSKLDKFLYKKEEPGKTNLWYVVYNFGILLDLIEEYPDLKKDVLKWLIMISEEKEGEYQKFFLKAKQRIGLDELTKLAALIEKLDGGLLSLYFLGTEPLQNIISSLINGLDLSIKENFNIKLSHRYIGELFVLLVNSPTAFIEFIRFLEEGYDSKTIATITEVRDIMGIYPIMISETENGLTIINMNLKWFETENRHENRQNPEVFVGPLTIISELNDILYRAFMKDLKEGKTPPLTITILRDTQNKLIEFEREKKRKVGKKGFLAYLKQLLRSENTEAHDLKLEKEESYGFSPFISPNSFFINSFISGLAINRFINSVILSS